MNGRPFGDLLMPLQDLVNDNEFKLNERSSSCVNLHTEKTKTSQRMDLFARKFNFI